MARQLAKVNRRVKLASNFSVVNPELARHFYVRGCRESEGDDQDFGHIENCRTFEIVMSSRCVVTKGQINQQPVESVVIRKASIRCTFIDTVFSNCSHVVLETQQRMFANIHKDAIVPLSEEGASDASNNGPTWLSA